MQYGKRLVQCTCVHFNLSSEFDTNDFFLKLTWFYFVNYILYNICYNIFMYIYIYSRFCFICFVFINFLFVFL